MLHHLTDKFKINSEFYILNKDKYIVNENNKYTINLIPPGEPDSEVYVLSGEDCVLDKEQIKNESLIQTTVTYEKLHTSGWTIKAKMINNGYYIWTDYHFEADHHTYGKIIGDLEANKIHVTSLDAFKHFTDNHPIGILDLDYAYG